MHAHQPRPVLSRMGSRSIGRAMTPPTSTLRRLIVRPTRATWGRRASVGEERRPGPWPFSEKDGSGGILSSSAVGRVHTALIRDRYHKSTLLSKQRHQRPTSQTELGCVPPPSA